MDSEAKKACPGTSICTLYCYIIIYMYSASRTYHSERALAQVVLPAYIIAPVKIHAELEKVLLIHVTVC